MVRPPTLLLLSLMSCGFDTSGLAPRGDARLVLVPDAPLAHEGGGDRAGGEAIPAADRSPDLEPVDPCPKGGLWERSAIAVGLGTNAGDTYDPALALDPQGMPHVSFYNCNQGKLHYASLGTTWSIEEVAQTGSPNWHWWSALVIDGNGQPHVAYHQSGCNVMVATRPLTKTTWDVTKLEGAGATLSLALDGAGKLHLAYTVTGSNETTPGEIKLTSNVSGAWQNPGTKVGDGHYTSLSVDEKGKHHLAWYETAGQKLRYATDASGSWVLEYPDPTLQAGVFPALVRRQDGTILIAYYDRANGDLKLARKAPAGIWTTEVVEAKDDVGLYPSLAVSPDGTLNLSFYDATHKDLRHARREPKGWSVEPVDTQGDVGRFPSLAIGPDRRAHVAYFDETGRGVKYATHPCR